MNKFFKLAMLTLVLSSSIFSAVLDEFYWLLLQIVPNYTISQKNNLLEGKYYNGMSWEATPLFISFFPNRFVSRYSIFKVQPVDRMSGGLEFFMVSNYYPSDDFSSNWLHQGGARLFLPLVANGEILGLKVGSSYVLQDNKSGYSIESGFYFYYGLFDLTYRYYYNVDSQYSLSFNVRYF